MTSNKMRKDRAINRLTPMCVTRKNPTAVGV